MACIIYSVSFSFRQVRFLIFLLFFSALTTSKLLLGYGFYKPYFYSTLVLLACSLSYFHFLAPTTRNLSSKHRRETGCIPQLQ